MAGWDFNTISSSVPSDGVNHYYLGLSNSFGGSFTLTATLVWNRQAGKTSINDLDLFLYDASNSNLIASSISRVDNVEHIFLTKLPPGRYDLQVLKNGGLTNRVTNLETYSLAFEMFSMPLQITPSAGKVAVSWPLSPTGFRLEGTADLAASASWVTLTNATAVSNGLNTVVIEAANGRQFFRLQRP